MNRIVFLTAALFFLLLPLSACSSGTLENTAVIKAVAFDLPEEGEEGFLMTACILNPDGEKPYITVSAEGESMTEAISELSAATERKPFFSQCEVLVFSEALAQKGIEDILEWFYHSHEGKDNALLCVTRGDAQEAFLYTEGLFKDPAVDISRTLKNADQNGGHILASLAETALSLKSISACSLLPVCEITGEDAKSFRVCGAGILRDGSLSGELDERERLGAKCLLSIAEGSSFSVTDGQEYAVTLINAISSLSAREDSVACDSQVSFKISEGAFRGDTDLTDETEAYLTDCMRAAFRKAQKEGDFLGLAAVMTGKDAKLMEKYRDDWQTALESISFDVSVNAGQRGGGYAPEGSF